MPTRAGALLVNAILLAANNGYDEGQITGFILDELLDPKVADTEEGLLSLRGPFLFGGVLAGVAPNGEPVGDVFKVARLPKAPKSKAAVADADADAPFVGELELGGSDWTTVWLSGTPAISESRIELRVADDRLVGEFFVVIEVNERDVRGPCLVRVTFDGTIDIPSDKVGYHGDVPSTATYVENAVRPALPAVRCPPPVGSAPVGWTMTAARTGEGRISGELKYQGRIDEKLTFEAAR